MSEKNENVKIQVASVEDAEELLAIYAPYVERQRSLLSMRFRP